MFRSICTAGLAMLASACSTSAPADQAVASTETPSLTMPVPTNEAKVEQLLAAFDANEVAAMQNYGGGPLMLTGTVRGVVLDMGNDPAVLFESGRKRPVQALFDKERGKATAAFKKGEQATVICNELREVMGNPILDDCWVEAG